MLGVGLDWAEHFHDVAIGLPGQGVIEQFRIEHGPASVKRLIAKCVALQRLLHRCPCADQPTAGRNGHDADFIAVTANIPESDHCAAAVTSFHPDVGRCTEVQSQDGLGDRAGLEMVQRMR
jgi:hypothetical protein